MRAGRLVVVDLRLFAIKSFSRGNVAALIVALGEFGLLFVLPLYLQGALGLSALDTGAVLIPLAAGTLLAGGADALLAPRLGPRGVVQLGLLLEVLGIGALGVDPRCGYLGRDDHPMAVHLRGRRRVRDRATDRRDPHRRPGAGERAGLGDPEHLPAGWLGPRDRDPGHDPHHHARVRSKRTAAIGAGPPPARQAAIASAVRASGGSAIVELRDQPGTKQIVEASAQALASSASTAAFTAAGFVLFGLLFTAGLPNPRDTSDERAAQQE